jgi:hypothetical protein
MRPVFLIPLTHKRSLSAPTPNASAASPQFARVLAQTTASLDLPHPISHRPSVSLEETRSSLGGSSIGRTSISPRATPLFPRLARIHRLENSSRLVLDRPRSSSPRVVGQHKQSGEIPSPVAQGAQASAHTYGAAIAATAQRLQVDPALSLGIARAESGVSAATDKNVRLNPKAVSQDGKSAGLFQLTHETGTEQLQRAKLRQPYNPFNAQQSMYLGISYLKHLLTIFSQETTLQSALRTVPGTDSEETHRLAIAAYNAGMGRVARAQQQARKHGKNPARYEDVAPYLPPGTQQYVKRVERYAAEM